MAVNHLQREKKKIKGGGVFLPQANLILFLQDSEVKQTVNVLQLLVRT